MAAIKVVQIAIAAGSDGLGGAEAYAEYLDDQGRVWFQNSNYVYPEGSTSRQDRKLVTEWKQLELPEEPAV